MEYFYVVVTQLVNAFVCIFSLIICLYKLVHLGISLHRLRARRLLSSIDHYRHYFYIIIPYLSFSHPNPSNSCISPHPIPLPPFDSFSQFPPTSCRSSLSSSNLTLLLAALPFTHRAFLNPFNSSTQPLAAHHANPINHPKPILPAFAAAPA